MREKKWWIPYIIAGIVLLIGTFFDYQIDAFLYHPQNMLGIIMQRYILCFFITSLALVFALLQRVHRQWLFLLPELIAAVYAVVEVGKYHISIRENIILVLLIGITLAALCNVIIYRFPIERLKRMEKKAVFFACVFITAVVIAGILKCLWGRVRFRELEHITQYSIWFLPQGINGHHSFPSGHTITLSTILCLLVTMKDCEKQQIPWYVTVFVYGMICIMGLSRMIMGAHFLSDVTAGFLITYTVFLLYRSYFYRKRYL